METGAITSYIDVAQLVLYAFWIFFAGLIFYIRREDKREGYPMESDLKHITAVGFPPLPEPKKFIKPHNGGVVYAPAKEQMPQYPLAAEPIAKFPGAALVPTGDPMVDAVGPAAYAQRPDVPDISHHGDPRIVPMRVAPEFSLCDRDPDPRGMEVVGADNKLAGHIIDIWVDRSEPQIRYLEVDANGRIVLLPMNYVTISNNGRYLRVASIKAEHFANVPTLSNPKQVTLLEEDKITAYYGGGHMYAFPERSEPLI